MGRGKATNRGEHAALSIDPAGARAERTRFVYFKLARWAGPLRKAMHALLILLFIGWQIATWTGDPSNTPAHLMTLLVVVSCIAIFDQLTPFLKAALIGQGFKPSRKRKLAAVLFSAACVAAALVLNLYSRAFFGFYPDLPTYLDYQRTLMVMSYWATSCAPPRPPWPHSSAAPSAPVHTPALGQSTAMRFASLQAGVHANAWTPPGLRATRTHLHWLLLWPLLQLLRPRAAVSSTEETTGRCTRCADHGNGQCPQPQERLRGASAPSASTRTHAPRKPTLWHV